MKKRIAIILSTAMLCMACSGCGKNSNQYSFSIYLDRARDVDIRGIIGEYVKLYPEKKVEIIETSSLSSSETDFKLQTELMSGKGPDVVLISERTFPDVDKTMLTGAFCDLNEFLETDENYNPEDYYQPILQMGSYDGKQCMIPYQFNIPILLTTQRLLDKNGFNKDNCTDYEGYIGEIAELIEKNEKQDWLLFANENEIHNPFDYFDATMVDFKSKTVNLDTELFYKIMADNKKLYQYKQNKANMFFLPYGEVGEYLSNDKMVFEYSISGDNLMENAALIALHDTPILVPIRDTDGGLMAKLNSAIAISQNSKNKQNAYHFISYLLSPKVQAEYGYPISKKVFSDKVTQKSKQYKTGLIFDPETPQGKTMNRPVKSPSDQFFDDYEAILNDISRCTIMGGLSTKVFSHFKPYFEDKKSLEACLKQAQDQLEIYISE